MSDKGQSHVYNRIFLHITWHCLADEPCITSSIEEPLFEFLKDHCVMNKGVHFKGLGGTSTHIHLVIQLEPHVEISTFVGKLKGASAHSLNKRFGQNTLRWQRGFGVVSFAEKHLDFILEYVHNQKEHHRTKTLREILENSGQM